MKNLKRVLSLVLATVMVIGMMVVGASAVSYNDFTDKDEIVNAEAVALLNDLGIIEGYNGTYAPNATIDRAGMAKLITKIMMGDVDPAVFAGTTTDLTDIDGHWAEGYIKYCYTNGIISGYAGKFDPNGTIEVVGAAKMLLVALGYDAENRGYANDTNWTVNVMRDATTTREFPVAPATVGPIHSLLQGLNVKASAPLTRDVAAQMIMNAMFVATVEPNYQWDMGTQYIQNYTAKQSLADTMFNGLDREVGVLTDVAGGKVNTWSGVSLTGLATVNASSADVGQVVVIYRDRSNKAVSTVAVPDADITVYTMDGAEVEAFLGYGGAGKDLKTNATGNAKFSASATSANKTNGVLTALETVTNQYTISRAAANTYVRNSAKKVGATVELIDSGNDGIIDVLRVTDKTAAVVNAAPKTYVVNDVTYIYIPFTSGGKIGVASGTTGAVKASDVVGYEDLAKGDTILWYTLDGVYYVEKADSFVGQATMRKAGKLTINGTEYDLSGLDGKVANTISSFTAFNKDVTFVTDNYGHLLSATPVTEELSEHVVILSYVRNDKTGGYDGSDYTYQAELLFQDGTAKVVELAGNDAIAGMTIATPVGEVQYIDGQYTTFWTYSVNKDGQYTLTAATGDYSREGASGTISTGVATLPGASATANSKTTFIVKHASGSKVTYSVHTGIANVPNLTSVTASVLVKDGAAVIVYVASSTGATVDNSTKNVYLMNLNKLTYVGANGDDAAYYLVDAIVEGEVTTIKVETKFVSGGYIQVDGSNNLVTSAGSSLNTADLYNVTVTNGCMTKAEPVADVTNKVDEFSGATITAAANDVITVAGAAYTYTSDAVVYIIDAAAGTVQTTTIDAVEDMTGVSGAAVFKGVNTPDNTTITALYIVK